MENHEEREKPTRKEFRSIKLYLKVSRIEVTHEIIAVSCDAEAT